jgi:hypothetical protein
VLRKDAKNRPPPCLENVMEAVFHRGAASITGARGRCQRDARVGHSEMADARHAHCVAEHSAPPKHLRVIGRFRR